MRGRSTTQLRYDWGDGVHCYSGPLARFTLHGGAVISVRPALIPVLKAFNTLLIKHGYRCTPPDCGAMNCRSITGGKKISLHGLAIAWDLNWNDNPWQLNDGTIVTDFSAAFLDDVEALTTGNGKPLIRCGARYTGAHVDPMHFEMCCTPADLATGIKGLTVPAKPASQGQRPGAVWRPFRPGATNASIIADGGLDNEIFEVQLILTALGINVGRPDGNYGPKSQAGVSELKRRMIVEQKKRGLKPWPNTDANVGHDFIKTARFLNHQSHALAA